MSEAIERRYPLVIGIVFGIGFFIFFPLFPVSAEAAPSLFSATVSAAAIAVGFLATAKSILLSIDSKPIIANLKAIGKYNTLIDYLMAAVTWSFSLAAISVFCFLPDLKIPAEWHRWLFAVWIFVIFTAGCSCFRVIQVFGKILRAATL